MKYLLREGPTQGRLMLCKYNPVTDQFNEQGAQYHSMQQLRSRLQVLEDGDSLRFESESLQRRLEISLELLAAQDSRKKETYAAKSA